MKSFLAVYTGTPEAMARWHALPEDERAMRQAEGFAAWTAWSERNRDAILQTGGPLGRTKRVSGDGITDIRNHLAAYVVVQAPSHEAAAEMFVDHPHFTLFPGDGVEIMECLPIPGA